MGGIVPRGSAAGDGMWFCGHGGGTELCGAVGYGVEEWGAHLGPFGGTPDLSLLLWLSWDVRPRCATPQSPLTSPNDRPGLGSVSSVPQRPLLFPIHWLRSPSRCPPPPYTAGLWDSSCSLAVGWGFGVPLPVQHNRLGRSGTSGRHWELPPAPPSAQRGRVGLPGAPWGRGGTSGAFLGPWGASGGSLGGSLGL